MYSEKFYLNFTPLDNAKAGCFFPFLLLTLIQFFGTKSLVRMLRHFYHSIIALSRQDLKTELSLFGNCQATFCCFFEDVYVYMCFSTGLKNEYEFSNKTNLWSIPLLFTGSVPGVLHKFSDPVSLFLKIEFK